MKVDIITSLLGLESMEEILAFSFTCTAKSQTESAVVSVMQVLFHGCGIHRAWSWWWWWWWWWFRPPTSDTQTDTEQRATHNGKQTVTQVRTGRSLRSIQS